MKNLEYKKLEESHEEELIAVWGDVDVIKYTNIKSPCSRDEIKKRMNRFKDSDIFVVTDNNEFIGIIGCPCVNKEKCEYGVFYQFKKSAWGRGYATESVKWLINYMKNKYLKVILYADVVVNNIASEKILKKFGFVFMGAEENAFNCEGIEMTINNYKLELEK